MPTRPHTNTCNAVLSALENIRDMDEAALKDANPAVRYACDALIEWRRGQEMDHVTDSGRIRDIAREWADLFVMDGTSDCDCDAKFVPVVARRWHRGHDTTAPAKIVRRLTQDSYLVEFLTPGPGEPQQMAYRYAMAVAIDDINFVDAMEITPTDPTENGAS